MTYFFKVIILFIAMNSAMIFFVAFMFVCSGTCSSFTAFGEYEYYVEAQQPASHYSKAERRCAHRNATLAVVNSQKIRNFLVQQIGIRTREYSIIPKFLGTL